MMDSSSFDIPHPDLPPLSPLPPVGRPILRPDRDDPPPDFGVTARDWYEEPPFVPTDLASNAVPWEFIEAADELDTHIGEFVPARQALDRLRHRVAASGSDAVPEATVAATLAVRDLAQTLAHPGFLLRQSPDERSAIEAGFDRLVAAMDLDLDAFDRQLEASGLPPLWLDVVAPAHRRLVVWESQKPSRIVVSDTPSVVLANNSRLEVAEHHRIRRISLDCEPLFQDKSAMELFTAMMLNPTPRAHEAFRQRMEPGRSDAGQAGKRRYGRQLPPSTAAIAEDGTMVALEDHSRLRTSTLYRIDEVAIPLADMLMDDFDLVRAMATRFAQDPPDPAAADPFRMIRGMVGDLGDDDLLSYAAGLGGDTEVTRSFFDQRVNLAAAVMVGYGNTLKHNASVGVSWSASRALRQEIAGSVERLREAVDIARPTPAPPPVRKALPPVEGAQLPPPSPPLRPRPPIRRDIGPPGIGGM